MCGICGILWKQRGLVDEETIRRVNRSMAHRGPDDEGYFTDGATQLAMRRLSIIDVKGGHQPITTGDGRYTIVFNGEIYNYQATREDLMRRGHRFTTNSDTETILRGYAEWGAECVHRLRGMFGFAIWDRDSRELFVARDRLGIKPFFFIDTPQWFAFASEVKALLCLPGCPRAFDYETLHHHLAFHAIPTPRTMFRDIRALPPGYHGRYRDGTWRTEQYWDVPFRVDLRMSEDEAVAGLEATLSEAVKLHLISEVPLGAFLSGGVDSSLVVAMMARHADAPVKTFSIGWGKEYADFNEVEHARAVAGMYATDHHEHTVTTGDLLAELPRIVWHYDQPTPSAFQTYFVSKFTKSQGITVALSGLGGDEIAAGYPYFPQYAQHEAMWERAAKIPAPLLRLLARACAGTRVGRAATTAQQTPGWRFRYHRMLDGIDGKLGKLYVPPLAERALAWDSSAIVMNQIDSAASDSIVNRVIYHDLRRFMVDDPLTDTDRCSMAHSLEVRVPLIDHVLVEYAGTIPPHFKVRKREAKYLLKRVAEKYLPRQAMYRRKMGFEFPMVHWVNGPLRGILDAVLSEESVRRRGLFRPEEVSAWRRHAHDQPSRGVASFLWNLTVFELWCRLYIDPDTPAPPDCDTTALVHTTPRVSLAL